MTPNARATAHQRVPVGRCGVALPVFPKNSQIFIIARAIITVNTVPRKEELGGEDFCGIFYCKLVEGDYNDH